MLETRLTRRAVALACALAAACQGKPPTAPPKPERAAITAHDPGFQVLAEVANARWALTQVDRVFAENELARATRDATRLPDETSAIFAPTQVASGGRRSQQGGAGQLTGFDVLVRLQSAKEDVDRGDYNGAEEDLSGLAAATPRAPAAGQMPLIEASEAMSVAQADAADGVVTHLDNELECAREGLAGYSGTAHPGDAHALASEIARRLAQPGGTASIDPVQLEEWATRVAAWVQ